MSSPCCADCRSLLGLVLLLEVLRVRLFPLSLRAQGCGQPPPPSQDMSAPWLEACCVCDLDWAPFHAFNLWARHIRNTLFKL